MRRDFSTALIAFFILLSYRGNAQQDDIIYKEFNTSSWGYKAGLLIPFLRNGSENDPISEGFPVTYEVNYQNDIKPGVAFGLFYETRITSSFYIQIEANYQWYQQSLDYIKYFDDEYKTTQDADYSIKNSSIHIPVLPKFRFGNKNKIYLMAGPYVNIPFSTKVSGTLEVEKEDAAGKATTYLVTGNSINKKPEKMEVGIIGGVGIKVPLKVNGLLIEVRGGGSLNDVIKDPNYKASTFSVQLGVIKPLK